MKCSSLLTIQKIGVLVLVLFNIGLDLAKESVFATKHFSEAGYFMFTNGMFVLLLIIFNLTFRLLHKTQTIEKSDPVSTFTRVAYIVMFSIYWIVGTYIRWDR